MKSEALFEYLNRAGLSKRKFATTIPSWPDAKIKRFVERFTEAAEYDEENDGSMFSFVANTQLSGSIYPCKTLSCRIEHVRNLANFAALYADIVLIANPIKDI
jgi:hypothetical protein